MAAKLEQNFRAAIGEDLAPLTFTVLDGAGDAVDLTPGNTTVLWVMRTHPLSDVDVLSIAGTNLGSDGTFDITITNAVTAGIEPRVYFHSADVNDTNGIVTTVALGSADFYKYKKKT